METLNDLNNSVKIDLLNHLTDKINDGVLTDDNFNDWHYYAFNEDYFMIGYYQCSQWLKDNEIDAFEAIEIICEYENNHFGDSTFCKGKINSETTVNMLAYILGEELLSELCNNEEISVSELQNRIDELISELN